MQNKLVITIVDEKGSRQFQAHKHIKKIVFWGVLIFVGLIVGVFFAMKMLMQTIDEIALEQNIAISEYRYISQQNDNLKDQIAQKNNELSVINQKIGDLESILSTQKNNQKIQAKIEEIDLKALSLEEKKMVLTLIPNGDPLPSYKSKNPARSRENPSKLALGLDYGVRVGSPVYATADGVVDSVRTNYKRGFGSFIKLNHSLGFGSLYAHLDKVLVKRGEFVRRGDLIGYSGRSGAVGSGVLYYEVWFINRPRRTQEFASWNLESFDALLQSYKEIEWRGLVWILQDVLKLQNYQNTLKEQSDAK